MKPITLPNGNLLVPAVIVSNGRMITGMKEVAPGSTEYEEWVPAKKRPAQPTKPVIRPA